MSGVASGVPGGHVYLQHGEKRVIIFGSIDQPTNHERTSSKNILGAAFFVLAIDL